MRHEPEQITHLKCFTFRVTRAIARRSSIISECEALSVLTTWREAYLLATDSVNHDNYRRVICSSICAVPRYLYRAIVKALLVASYVSRRLFGTNLAAIRRFSKTTSRVRAAEPRMGLNLGEDYTPCWSCGSRSDCHQDCRCLRCAGPGIYEESFEGLSEEDRPLWDRKRYFVDDDNV